MEETISLQELFQTLRKRLKLILLITIIVTAASGAISYFILTPVYQSQTQILVNQTKNEQQPFTSNDVQTNLQLINTYNVIIKSPAILDKVKDKLNLNLSTDELNGKITVSSEQNSQVVSIVVTDKDPQMAAKIANTTAEVFKSQIVDIMKVDNVSILSKAIVKDHPSPVKPRPTLNMAIALVVGLMIGVGLAFLLEYLDNTIKDEQDIESYLELPVLGAISSMNSQSMKHHNATVDKKKRKVRGESFGA